MSEPALRGRGSASTTLRDAEVEDLLAGALAERPLDGKRVLVIVPDGTRTAPVPLLFRILCDQLAPRVRELGYLIALGTHPPMPEPAIARLVGMGAEERAARYPGVRVLNHRYDDDDALRTFGVISESETHTLSDGLLSRAIPVRLNRLVAEYDVVLLCGPVFPHEVAGFSGGAKYLFPGVAGPEIIDFTHWLGALCTSMETIGVRDTPVRRVIHRAADFVPCEVLCLTMVLEGDRLHGMWLGAHQEAFRAAAELSRELNIVRVPRPFRTVLSMPAARYDDLWTAAKAVYKTEPILADGGEVIVYAPHLREVSYTHGAWIDRVGYHVRDYFVAQWERFRDLPWAILAHSTHVRGAGTYDAAQEAEHPRIRVTLATGISEERCHRIGLGYCDPRTLDVQAFEGREDEGVLVVHHAGEKLYRLAT
ncbi:lactate racemase domain-containing protein [Pendulispora albinea]|uniref:Lactate racemase domain-containing protein n=1 Tax=Pendulispora albinea TaxID=2741071 RepID=A0ABZ2M8U5_9BACT